MSNELQSLLARVEDTDPATAKALRRHIEALQGRRQFGLNFERHMPESVALTGRPISVGDKVRFLPPRGETEAGSDATWIVTGITGIGQDRVAVLVDPRTQTEVERVLEDLVYVADFRDPIYPGLKRSGVPILRGGDKPFHTVINAENYHALEALLFTHQGKVDCIYIDPPYNTRANDWKYNNDYVDPGDSYAHSKWLAFMERRLKLAKKLLKPCDSVLIVTVDEKEYLRLGLLLEQTFPEARIQMVTIVINPNGVARGAELGRVEEYAFFCFLGDATPARVADPLLGEQDSTRSQKVRWEWLMRGGSNSRRIDRPNLFYPVFVDAKARRIAKIGQPIPLDVDPTTVPDEPGLETLWPIRTNGTEANWRTSPEYLQELLDLGYAKLGAYDATTGRWSVLYLGKAQIRRINDGALTIEGRAADGSVIVQMGADGRRRFPKTVWNRPAHSAGEFGSRMLRTLIPSRDFPFPKSLYAVEDALRTAIEHKPEAVILDFFSGSGTTAHAVMRLNREDGGRRRSISVTNNEVSMDEQKSLVKKKLRPGDPEWEALGICDYITKPRITAAVTGLTPAGEPVKGEYKFVDEFPMSEGFDENVEFFTLTYENPALVELDMAFERIAPLLWLRAGSEGRRIEKRCDTFEVADTYAVLFDVDASRAFLEAVDQAGGLRIAYVVTDDETQYQAVAGQLPDGVESVRLYESYLRTFQINTGRA